MDRSASTAWGQQQDRRERSPCSSSTSEPQLGAFSVTSPAAAPHSPRQPPRSFWSVTSLCLAAILAMPGGARAEWNGEWHSGRATRYGGWDDGWNIHEGSCGYGYLDKDRSTGWDIAAMSDTNWDYSGSCGRCLEVRCDPTYLQDNYGESFDRTHVCHDPDASVIVQVTDSCPCYYPTNAYSNKRWCCGDMYHLDLSTWAFEKLAENRWGVIGVVWRSVACDFEPGKRAPVRPEGESAPNTRISRPDGWSDRRPWP